MYRATSGRLELASLAPFQRRSSKADGQKGEEEEEEGTNSISTVQWRRDKTTQESLLCPLFALLCGPARPAGIAPKKRRDRSVQLCSYLRYYYSWLYIYPNVLFVPSRRRRRLALSSLHSMIPHNGSQKGKDWIEKKINRSHQHSIWSAKSGVGGDLDADLVATRKKKKRKEKKKDSDRGDIERWCPFLSACRLFFFVLFFYIILSVTVRPDQGVLCAIESFRLFPTALPVFFIHLSAVTGEQM